MPYKQFSYSLPLYVYIFQQNMQSFPDYVKMANEIHNLQVYNQMYQQMSNFSVLQHIFLTQVAKSQTLLFVACQILSKKLVKHELLLGADDIDANGILNSSLMTEDKKGILLIISQKLYQMLNHQVTKLPDYILKSCINTISLCISSTITSISYFDSLFLKYLKMMAPDFNINQQFIQSKDSKLTFIEPSPSNLGFHHQYMIQVLNSLLDYIVNSTYFLNYYYFRRNLYAFRGNYLGYLLNYSIFCLKSAFKATAEALESNVLTVNNSIRPALKLFQNIVTYPFSLNMHQSEVEDDIHEDISGLKSQIYFPTYFRNLLCDTGFLLDIISYYSKLNTSTISFNQVRQDLYSLVRIIGRVIGSSEYVFAGQMQKKAFRALSTDFVTKILKQNCFFDSYLILCISKINIKFMSIQNDDELFEGKRQYFCALTNFLCKGVALCQGKIQDGDKHPFRQLFQILTAFVNITANTILDSQSKNCAQQALNILFKKRLVDNAQNTLLMKQFGYNNSQQIDCFMQIFGRVPQIFKINLPVNLTILHQLNLNQLNSQSLTFWLHLTALLLPEHDTSIQQTQLILKFLQAAIKARSIASLHYIQTLVSQILYEIRDGVSTTYLWKFIEQSKAVSFQQFLSYIIQYAMKILTIPNYALIENCLQLFKAMFSKLCRHRHKSFIKYFEIIEQVCKQIDKTMLVHQDYIKLRVGFFSIISIIWINQGQVSFVYRIFNNIRQSLGEHTDLIHFIRYMTDITGLLEPVQSSQIYKILIELVLVDMRTILPYYFSTSQKLSAAFSNELFLKTFIKFLLTIVNDNGYRLTNDSHTSLPFQIEQVFRSYLVQALKYDYPVKTIQAFLKFIKLNPLGKLLPLQKSMKQKNSHHYKSLIREYFENLHRLDTLDQFYYMYSFVEDNIELMNDWWEQIMTRRFKPDIDVKIVVNARVWSNTRQKQYLGKLLFRIAKYDERYWKLQCDANSQSKYAEWFLNYYA